MKNVKIDGQIPPEIAIFVSLGCMEVCMDAKA